MGRFASGYVLVAQSTRYTKYVGGISIYWCKAKQSGHLATVSDYFPFIKLKYYFKLLYYKLNLFVSWICRTCVSLYLATLIDKTLRRTVSLYSVLPCRRLSSDCRHVRHKLTIMPRSGAVLTLTIDYVIRSNLFNRLHMTGVRASPPLSSTT